MEALRRGHRVIFVTGKSSYIPEGVEIVGTVSAQDMYNAVMERFKEADVIIGAAAVGDFTTDVLPGKIKRKENLSIVLKPTKDILAAVGAQKGKRTLVGFAAEAGPSTDEAVKKIKRKKLDMIVFNDITKKGSGFGSDTNEITIMDHGGRKIFKGSGTKKELAAVILDLAEKAGKK
jgi:phosphopantothenoylcysteine decarboxylase/phosphopantothenate--cysteine ligase